METQSACARDGSGSLYGSSCIALADELLKNQTLAQFIFFVLCFPSSLFVVNYLRERMSKKTPKRRAPCTWRRGVELSSYICFQTWRGRQAW